MVAEVTGRGVGARLPRNEDRRHLHGRGHFVADVQLPGLRDVAFVRSPRAHGKITGIETESLPKGGVVITAQDLAHAVRPIVANVNNPNFRSSEYPVLARDVVRFVGEPIAMVVADDRARAEDLAESVAVDIDPLPAVVDSIEALQPDSPLVHDAWPDNRFLEVVREFGDVDRAAAEADVHVTRTFRLGRHAPMPLETRGCVAYLDHRTDQLVLYSSTQFPHVVKSMLAELLGMQERRIRVIAPDVGGGFGSKVHLYPEELAICALALRLGHPVRWIEDRYEHMVGSTHARDHRYRLTAHATSSGELLAVEADIVVDSGAYSVWPWTAFIDAGMSAAMVPGPYKIRDYRYRTAAVATNKPPAGVYRGVGRPGACFAIERLVDEVAHEVGLEPKDVRSINMVGPEDMPYVSVTDRHYDSGDYPESVRRVAELIGHDEVRARQSQIPATANKRVGVGYASFTEQTAHGCTEWASRGMPVVFAFETARAKLDQSGSLSLEVGIQSHGQGLETSLAQVASDELGVDPSDVTVHHGDTGRTPYGMGTFGSRSIVMAGGAVKGATKELASRVKGVAAALLNCAPSEVRLTDGKATGPESAVTLAEVAQASVLHVDRLPQNLSPSLEVTYHYQPREGEDRGTYSYSTHAAVVEVDLDTAHVRVEQFAVVEDCGRIVNPLIVDGQIQGGVAQGIGAGLLEEYLYDDQGQPKVTTFLDYMLPGASEIPEISVGHMSSPNPLTELGAKGMGEGGSIAPAAAIANAVTDALKDMNVSVARIPITPERLWLAMEGEPEAVAWRAETGGHFPR